MSVNETTGILSISGYKTTKQRDSIIDILLNAKAPVTAEEIYLQMKRTSASIAFSTIYRNMEILLKKGIITKTIYNDGKFRFKLLKNKHTHYLVCLKCNKAVPIEKCPMESLEKNLEEQTGFNILDHNIEIYGHCSDCRQ